eukprot:scaffold155569_cov22-Tisochrysis_lutea.AAC.1
MSKVSSAWHESFKKNSRAALKPVQNWHLNGGVCMERPRWLKATLLCYIPCLHKHSGTTLQRTKLQGTLPQRGTWSDLPSRVPQYPIPQDQKEEKKSY